MKCSKCVYSNEVSENWQVQLTGECRRGRKRELVAWVGWMEKVLAAGQACPRLRAQMKCSKIGTLSNPLADTDIRVPMQYVCMYVCVICELCVKFNVSVTKWRAATTAPEFRLNDNSSASRASFPPFPIFHFRFAGFLSWLAPPSRSLRWPYKNVRFLFIWWNEIQFLNALRCCAARTSLQLQFLGAARDIDIFISQYICINSDCSGTIKARTACRQRYERERKLSNTY